MKVIIVLLLILYQVVGKLACVPDPTDQQAAAVWDYYVKNHYEGKVRYTRGYDDIPKSKIIEYGKWLINYVKEQRIVKVQHEKYPSIFDLPNDEWKGIGGEGGQLPPPWAYVKGGYVRPDFCFYQLVIGKCPPKYNQKVVYTRYTYNSWTERCEAFNYSGCGGNENRFTKKHECERVCRSDNTCCDDQMYFTQV